MKPRREILFTPGKAATLAEGEGQYRLILL